MSKDAVPIVVGLPLGERAGTWRGALFTEEALEMVSGWEVVVKESTSSEFTKLLA